MKRWKRRMLLTAAWLGLTAALGAEGPTLQSTLKGHTEPVAVVAFSPDGKSLVSRSMDGTIRLWDVAAGTGALLGEKGWLPAPVAFSPDGKTLAAACGSQGAIGFKDGGIKLFDAAAGKEVGTVDVGPNGPAFKNLVFSPDGKTLAGGSVYSVSIWDAAKGKALRTLEKSPAVINPPVVFSPDGKTVAAGCTDAKARLWDVASGKIVATLNGYTGQPAFSPDGTTLAVGCQDGTIQIYTLPAGR